MSVSSKNTYIFVFVTALMVMNQFATTLFLPALPAMTHALHVSKLDGQLCFTFYLLGVCVSQFCAGVFADTLGRKKILLILSAIYIVGALLSSLASHISTVYVGLLIQGIGIGGPYAIAYSLIRDYFPQKICGTHDCLHHIHL